MITTSLKSIKTTIILVVLVLTGCVKDRNFDEPKKSCASDLVANATYSEVKNLYTEGVIQIQDDLIIEGYVISSDEAGNFFSSLHFQDKPDNPSEGFQLEFDLRDSHLFYPVRSKIFIQLKGLYLGKQKGVYKLGGTFSSFGNLSIGRYRRTSFHSTYFLPVTYLFQQHLPRLVFQLWMTVWLIHLLN